MKPILKLIFISLVVCLLVSCTLGSPRPDLTQDVTREAWRMGVDTNARNWTRGADSWFLRGQPNDIEIRNRRAGLSVAMSTMMVNLPEFTRINVNGDFKVQLFGTNFGNNSAYVYGPAAGVRNTIVEMRGSALNISQSPNAKGITKRVIVRIGVRNLSELIQSGSGTIEGVQIQSSSLNITQTQSGRGDVYLAGNMNVRRIMQVGCGKITVLGAITPKLDIVTYGQGAVNVAGNVGISSILHHGNADINIIGANSNSLRIVADGNGKIGIHGPVCLKSVSAAGYARVFVDQVNSVAVSVCVNQHAAVGLAGQTGKLTVDAYDNGSFYGRYLCARESYVHAWGSAHVNVAATNRAFASSIDNSSIYFFGPPSILSPFVRGNGSVIPMWGPGYATTCFIPPKVGNVYPVQVTQVQSPRRHHGISVDNRRGAG